MERRFFLNVEKNMALSFEILFDINYVDVNYLLIAVL